MSPEQELFDWFYVKAYDLTDNVYDYLPAKDEPVNYPFIKIGDVYTTSNGTKTSLGGTYTVYIDVWGARSDRLAVTKLTEELYKVVFGKIETENFKFTAFLDRQQKQIMTDTSVPNSVFIRGRLVFELERV